MIDQMSKWIERRFGRDAWNPCYGCYKVKDIEEAYQAGRKALEQRLKEAENLAESWKAYLGSSNLLASKLAKAEAVIEFYADKENWFGVETHDGYFAGVACEDYNEGNPFPDERHGGKRARDYINAKKQ